MPWNECLYHYHKKYGGQFLAGAEDGGLLVLTHKEQPLAVDLFRGCGRYSALLHVQARIPVTLAKTYKLTVGAEKMLSGGVNTALKAVPAASGFTALPANFGFPEVTKKRLIRSNNHPFTKLVLGSLDFRSALLACPKERLEVCPGPGEEGLHLITVTTDTRLSPIAEDDRSGWYLGDYYMGSYNAEEKKAQEVQRMEAEFFPRMDQFLELAKAAYNAVTQWTM